MKPESVSAMTGILNDLKEQVMALPRLQQFINTINEDGSGCVIAIVENQEI
ncbi:hypothetical protein [uncultured Roseobacter sp.]|uniref:hypothetical protein n=1 Tax=uncultured Roseobacter sp. TaxID=114847 RepID=UPI00261AD5BA|nr:hypothetical protein [uncultured Roseobacter sp.]